MTLWLFISGLQVQCFPLLWELVDIALCTFKGGTVTNVTITLLDVMQSYTILTDGDPVASIEYTGKINCYLLFLPQKGQRGMDTLRKSCKEVK